MSKQELLEKTSFYLEKLTDDKFEEIFHYVEFMYSRNKKVKEENMDFFDFYGKGKGLCKNDSSRSRLIGLSVRISIIKNTGY
ncbi:MAG TPA: hypothetical protein PLX69_04580 [Leptospiraceae bacterium]|nr:hypothetical protein [Leptospiraceae bacterium]HRG73814.1 hypothetical protein [Leptospiraceae bacterium]